MIIKVIHTEESLNENMKSHDLKPNYPGCSNKEVQAETTLSLHPSLDVNVTLIMSLTMNEQAAVRLQLILALPWVIKWIFNLYLLTVVSQEYVWSLSHVYYVVNH